MKFWACSRDHLERSDWARDIKFLFGAEQLCYEINAYGRTFHRGKSIAKYMRSLVIDVRIYKQQFLHSDWLRACQLIPNQCKKEKLSAKRWNWVQKSEIECKTVKLKWLTALTVSSDKQNGGQTLNKDWNSLSKFQHNYLITKQSAKLNNNN